MGSSGKKAPAMVVAPPPAVVEKQEPDVQVTAKKKRDKARGTSSSNVGLNRFLITPATGSGANVPE